MCHVAAADGGGEKGAGSGGSLVAVTSAGGVRVWGVPDLKGVTGTTLRVPLLATHNVKVTFFFVKFSFFAFGKYSTRFVLRF